MKEHEEKYPCPECQNTVFTMQNVRNCTTCGGETTVPKKPKPEAPEIGTSFDEFLKKDGIYDEVRENAIRKVIETMHKKDIRDIQGVSSLWALYKETITTKDQQIKRLEEALEDIMNDQELGWVGCKILAKQTLLPTPPKGTEG